MTTVTTRSASTRRPHRKLDAAAVRKFVEETVLERARHETADQVSNTRSTWAVESEMGAEYHGRYVLELVQNARDAWVKANPGRSDGVLRIALTEDPALIVCNQGAPLEPDVLLYAIGRFGEGDKTHGEAIGHKGIGFKSVLEVTRAPEVYSCRTGDDFSLRVRFDPDRARSLVRRETPKWDQLVRQLPSAQDPKGGDRIPTLLYPFWVEAAPPWLQQFARFGKHRFDTVVRLPYAPPLDGAKSATEAAFVADVRAAMAGVTDQIVLLLDAFGTVVLEDGDQLTTIVKTTEPERQIGPGTTQSAVSIRRNGDLSSRWHVFRHTLPGFEGLEGQIALGIRVLDVDDITDITSPTIRDGDHGEQFHLFFPTHIATHLPFLIHAYFEVDASRQGFAPVREDRNAALLGGLGDLGVVAVKWLVSHVPAAAASLPELFADVEGHPDDDLAARFRDDFLDALDDVAWVKTTPDESAPFDVERPNRLFVVTNPQLETLLPVAFPPRYLRRRMQLHYPSAELSASARGFLASRVSSRSRPGLDTDLLRELLTPGSERIWPNDARSMDGGFAALVDALDVLRTLHIEVAAEDLVGDPRATFIPVLDDSPTGRRLRGPAIGGDGDADDAGSWILARPSRTTAEQVAPPGSLGLDFLADGVLDEKRITRAIPLGIREYRSETVLSAIAGAVWTEDGGKALTRFAWQLLARDRGSTFSLRSVLESSRQFDPGAWYWNRPGVRSDPERVQMRRARGLSSLPLPASDGSWRPAGELVFGDSWADWCASRSSDTSAHAVRATAYRQTQTLAPTSASVVADIDVVRAEFSEPAVSAETAEHDRVRHDDLLHAFLLRLGVWEVPPVVGVNDYRDARDSARERFKTHALWSQHWQALSRPQPNEERHQRAEIAEDFAFGWPLASLPLSAIDIARTFARALSHGRAFYRQCSTAVVICPGCQANGGHRSRWENSESANRHSLLRFELDQTAWVPVTVAGSPAQPVRARDAWLDPDAPDPSKISPQSAYRFLPMVDSSFDDETAVFLKIESISRASLARVKRTLKWLHDAMPELLPADARLGTQEGRAFVAAHRLLYERAASTDDDKARSAVREPGVLTTLGTALLFTTPNEARHDDGRFATFRRHFVGRIPLLAVKADQTRVAHALVVPPVALTIVRADGEVGEDVTDLIRPLIHDRASEFLALAVFFSPAGGQTLELDSVRFRARAERLSSLRVVKVRDVRLDISIDGFDLEPIEVGTGSSEDLFLEWHGTKAPVLYLDVPSARWESSLPARLGPHLATLLENDAYGDVYRLLLEQDETRREAFLLERGVGEEELAQVEGLLQSSRRGRRVDETRWWMALRPLLGIVADAEGGEIQSRDRLLTELGELGLDDATAEMLTAAADSPNSRSDIAETGALATLERLGVSLRELHESLSALGDRGLDVRGGERRLEAWKRAHGRALEAIVVELGRADDVGWIRELAAPDELIWSAAPPPSNWLRSVLAELERAGLQDLDAERLAGDGAGEYLASLIDLTEEELVERWERRFSDDDRALGTLERERTAAWKTLLRPVVVAGRTYPGASGYEIRRDAAAVDEMLASTQSRDELAEVLSHLLQENAGLAAALADVIRAHRGFGLPNVAVLDETTFQQLSDPGHLVIVRAVLAKGTRLKVDALRKHAVILTEAALQPMPYAGSLAPPPPKPRTKRHLPPPSRRDQRHLDRLGADAESWVLASLVDRLARMPSEPRASVITAMSELLANAFEDDARVQIHVAHAEAALAANDDDSLIEALGDLMHVSKTSDAFGFDVLGYVEPRPGETPRAMFLEVKSSSDRTFVVSDHEWEAAAAAEIRPHYAFMIVVRGGEGGRPKSIELLPDPVGLSQLKPPGLRRSPSDWHVSYKPYS